MKRFFGIVLAACFLTLGVGVLLYPAFSNQLYERNSSRLVKNYDTQIQQFAEQPLNQLFQDALQYNRELAEGLLSGKANFWEDWWTSEKYLAQLNPMQDGLMGYIEIPKLELVLPIYHTTKEAVLQVGGGHVETSSLPVGGETAHAVLAGHSGLPSKELFTNLSQLERGDQFFITILEQTLTYEVDAIRVVEPDDARALALQSGKDLVTLLTCTPYGLNTYRLLVQGIRIE